MSSLVLSNMIVEFLEGTGWKWVGFDGALSVSSSRDRLVSAGEKCATDEDLRRLAAGLVGKSYAAEGFDDTPGTVREAVVEIDDGTLCDRAIIGGRRTVKTDTTGTFRVVCLPRSKSGTVLDPKPAQEGTWRVRLPASARTSC